jgi:hypothetical protein
MGSGLVNLYSIRDSNIGGGEDGCSADYNLNIIFV